MLDAVHEIFRLGTFRHEFEVLNAAANRDAKLVRVNQTGEGAAAPLAGRRFGKKVFIPTEHDASKLARPVKQVVIVEPGRAVGLGVEHIHTTGDESAGDGSAILILTGGKAW